VSADRRQFPLGIQMAAFYYTTGGWGTHSEFRMGNLSRRNQMKEDGNAFPEFSLGWTIGANGG